MRTRAIAAVAGVLLGAAPLLAADVRKPDKAPPAPPAPAAPALPQVAPAPPAPPGFQPGFRPGFQPGLQPVDPQKIREQMREQVARTMGLRVPPPAVKWGGMVLEPADAALLDQLNLPAGHGMVVVKVEAESLAAAAGLKKHDLVLKVNEQAVPTSARKLVKMLGEVKADTPLDLVVLRKGKEQTLKGAKLPEAALATPAGFGPPIGPAVVRPFGPPIGGPVVPPLGPPPPDPGNPGVAPIPGVQVQGRANVDGATISIKRDNNRFDASYTKDKRTVAIRGKMEANQAKVEEITVEEGQHTKKYQKVEDVPQEQRATVGRLLQMVSGVPGGLVPLPFAPVPAPPPLPARPPEKQ